MISPSSKHLSYLSNRQSGIALPLSSTSSSSTTTATTTTTETKQLINQFADDIETLSTLRPPSTDADISAPVTLISAGSSYTRFWTSSTWKSHSRPPHLRYARHILLWHTSTTARQIFPAVLISVLWATILSLMTSRIGTLNRFLTQVSGSTTAVSLLTAPLALLLTLRANSSLGRLQEARLLWGRLVLHSRTLSSLLNVYMLPHAPKETFAAARHLALLGWSVKAHVRGESIESQRETLRTLLNEATTDWLLPLDVEDSKVPKAPTRTALISRVRQLCAQAIQQTEIGSASAMHWTTPHLLIEEQIANLEQVIGGCERLHSSPIPPTYSRHLSRVMSMFLFFMPIGLVASSMGLFSTVLISTIASYVFVGIDEVGMEIENSFSLLPLQQLASAAHNSVRDQLVCFTDAPPIE